MTQPILQPNSTKSPFKNLIKHISDTDSHNALSNVQYLWPASSSFGPPRADIADLLLIPFVLPLAAIAFFVPLWIWKIHQKMISERDTEEDKFADRVAALKVHF